MFNIWNSNVFIEIGEAIGNVGTKVLKRRSSVAESVAEILRRRLSEGTTVALPERDEPLAKPDDDVIEGVFRVIPTEEER